VNHPLFRVLNFKVLHLDLGKHLGNFDFVKRHGGVSSVLVGNLLLFRFRLGSGRDRQLCKNAIASPVHLRCHYAETGAD
jgi:hypothetical protein